MNKNFLNLSLLGLLCATSITYVAPYQMPIKLDQQVGSVTGAVYYKVHSKDHCHASVSSHDRRSKVGANKCPDRKNVPHFNKMLMISLHDQKWNLLKIIDVSSHDEINLTSLLDPTQKPQAVRAEINRCIKLGRRISFYNAQGDVLTAGTLGCPQYNGGTTLSEDDRKQFSKYMDLSLLKSINDFYCTCPDNPLSPQEYLFGWMLDLFRKKCDGCKRRGAYKKS